MDEKPDASRCSVCGKADGEVAEKEPGLTGDYASNVQVCAWCLETADILVNARWAPPLFLSATFTRDWPHGHSFLGVSMPRRTAALRATLAAHQLLVAAGLLSSNEHPSEIKDHAPFNVDELIDFVDEVSAAARGMTTKVESRIAVLNELDEQILNIDGDSLSIANVFHVVESEHPELDMKFEDFVALARLWNNEDGRGVWQAAAKLLGGTPATLKSEWQRERRRRRGITEKASPLERKVLKRRRLREWLADAPAPWLKQRPKPEPLRLVQVRDEEVADVVKRDLHAVPDDEDPTAR
jgi:hypothetical protein